MDNLKESFEDVADWCEKHLEDQLGREIGMNLGAMLRAYGRLATLPSRLHGEERAATVRHLNAKAEGFLSELSARSLEVIGRGEKEVVLMDSNFSRINMTYDPGQRKHSDPTCTITNMTYDPGPRPKT